MTAHSRAVRAKTCISGRANFEHSPAMCVDCIIEDLSATGACVAFAVGLSVPKYFILTVAHGVQGYRARVMWQQANKVAVLFLMPRANAPEVLPD